MNQENFTIEEFGAKVKTKYPQYASYTDKEIGQRMLERYPQYQNRVVVSREEAPFTERIADIFTRRANKVGEAQTRQATGQQTGFETGLQTFGQGLGAAGETAFETVRSLPFVGNLVDKATKTLGENVVLPIAQSPGGQKAVQAWKSLTPRTQEDLSALFEIGSYAIGGGTGRGAVKASEVGAKEAVAKGSQLAVKGAVKASENLASKVRTGLVEDWSRIGQDYVKTEKILEKGATQGHDIPSFLADRGISPESMIKDRVYNTDEVASKLSFQDTQPIEDVLEKSLKEVQLGQSPLTLEGVEKIASQRVRSVPNLTAGDREAIVRDIQTEMKALRDKYGDTINLEDLNKEKRAYWANTKFESARPLRGQTNYQVGRAMKDTIEQNVKDVNVRGLNDELARYYEAANLLRSIDGKAIKPTMGQRVKRGLVRAAAVGIGGSVGNIPGGVTAYLLADSVTRFIESIPNPLKQYFVRQLQATNPKAYEDAVKYLGQREIEKLTRLALPPGSEIGTMNNPIITPPAKPIESGIRVVSAERISVKNPKTGKYERAYTSLPRK